MEKNKAEPIKKKVKEKPAKICPRCHEKYSYVERRKIGGNEYFYAVHVARDDKGKRHIEKHYLGPQKYIYCSMMHSDSGLEFSGMANPKRYQEYLKELRQVVKGGR